MITGCELMIESGPQSGTIFRLPMPTSCVIGRASDCDIALLSFPNPLAISRKQCRLDVTPNGVRVQDLGSRNGTFLNGELIGQRFCPEMPGHDWWNSVGRRVSEGDEISFVGVRIRVHVALTEEEWTPTEIAGVESAGLNFPYRDLAY